MIHRNRAGSRRTVCAAAACVCLLSACAIPSGGGSDSAERTPFDPDLYGWKTASWTPFAVTDTIAGFAYGIPAGSTGRYVAVARTGVIGWSDDGDIWYRALKAPDGDTPAPNPFAVGFNAAAYGGGRFVAVADTGKTAWSDDGKNWTAGAIADFGTENIRGIAFGNGKFVAVGGGANIAYSEDGITWTLCRDNNFGSSPLNDIAFFGENNTFYIVGNDGKRGWSFSPESGDWHYLPPEAPFNTNNIRKVAVGRYGNKIGIGIVFDEWSGKRTAIATNGAFGDFDADLDSGQFGNNAITGIAWGGGNFAAAGTSAMIGWWPSAAPESVNQRYWRALSFTEFRWWEISALAALKDKFFAGNVGGKIGYSK